MRLLIALLLAPLLAHADPQVTSTITACPMLDANRAVIPGISASTREITAVQKLRDDDALYDGTYYCQIEHKLVKTGNPRPVIAPEPEPVPEPNEPVPEPNEPAAHPPTDPQACIVYTRVPRTLSTEVTDKDGAVIEVKHIDALDSLPEVGRQFSNFNAPGQLVIHCPGEPERIIYDCVTDDQPCVPFDAMPSLDGRYIAFAVYRASGLENVSGNGYTYPIRQLSKSGNESEIRVYDTLTGQTIEWPHADGEQQTSPLFLPGNRIMFSSDRDRQFGPWLNRIGMDETSTPRLFIADLDGSNVEHISQHEMGGAMHPYLLSSGRVAYSSKWMTGNLPYIYNNGSINWPTTTGNMWVLQDMDMRGGDPTALYGSHHNTWSDGGKTINFKALHFVGERSNGDILISNYYRSNNLGLGDVIGFTPEPKLLEGPAPLFLPEVKYSLATWSTSDDSGAGRHDRAKIGWPEGAPDNQVIVTMGQGWCSSVAWHPLSMPQQIEAKGKIGCDVGIYRTTVIPSQAIGDMDLIVDRPEWHEFAARVVASRAIAEPELINTADGSCQIASSDAGSTDAHNRYEYNFNSGGNMKAAANNGTEIQGLDHSEVVAIRFYEVLPNTERRTNPNNSTGNKLRLFGDVPLLADKSFRAQLPCDTPYFMAGVDSAGRVVKRDQLPQSLRPGELRVCEGCHLHGSKGRPWADSLAYKAEPYLLPMSRPVPTYEADIKPILQARCASCHADDVPLFDYDDLVWDYFQATVPEGKKVQTGKDTDGPNRKYGLQRPYSSKYVHTQFAREGLLYWKAANARTDGRTDDQYRDDIDFGADHPTDMTDSELTELAAWLDSGATK